MKAGAKATRKRNLSVLGIDGIRLRSSSVTGYQPLTLQGVVQGVDSGGLQLAQIQVTCCEDGLGKTVLGVCGPAPGRDSQR